jgi:hypothetical protein
MAFRNSIDLKNVQPERAIGRSIGYVLLIATMLVGAFAFQKKMTWKSNREMHALLESIATVLALISGAMSFVRSYTKKTGTFLPLGSGFFGTALLKGYHAAITSSFVVGRTSSPATALSLWSGITPRLFLSLRVRRNILRGMFECPTSRQERLISLPLRHLLSHEQHHP